VPLEIPDCRRRDHDDADYLAGWPAGAGVVTITSPRCGYGLWGNRPASSSFGGSRHLADDVVDGDTWEAAPGLAHEISPKPLRHALRQS